jgi:hypothetical protein
MATLTSTIPDVDVLVALSPEELAEIVLRLAHEHRQNDKVHYSTSRHTFTVLQELRTVIPNTGKTMPS